MNWEKISNGIGLSLIAICFVFSLGRILSLRYRERPGSHGSQITLRIAHFQLEGGVREAVDAVAKAYTALHPNVRIQQIPIPEKIFKNWRITQLVGQTPPDLIQMGAGLTEEDLARYFLPLGELANKPNPYNKGTGFEKTPLRETFFDGMESGFNPILTEYYGVSATAATIRMFYNLDLLKEITGSTTPPGSYDEFVDLCAKTQAFAARTGRNLVPVGGSSYNGNILMNYFFTSQTQRLLQEKINRPGLLSPSAANAVVARAYWDNEWSMDSPEIKSGLTLVKQVASQMQPGFAQMTRDDAVFYFAQGGAVMIPSGTWDAVSLLTLSSFPIGIGMLPLPDASHPLYGQFAYGLVSEASANAGFTLAIPRDGEHPEIAADFLLFMAGMEMNKLWTDVSKWPPAVLGVEPSPGAKAFSPKEGGYPGGFPLSSLGADSGRLYASNLYLLTGREGSVEKFLAALKPGFGNALASDMKRFVRANKDSLRRSDSMLASRAVRAGRDPEALSKLDLLIQASVTTERATYQGVNGLVNRP